VAKNDYFSVQLGHLGRVATVSLPEVAHDLQDLASRELAENLDEGFSQYDTDSPWVNLGDLEEAYASYKKLLGRRQRQLADSVSQTASSLAEVVRVYGVADGQK
jgi:hypothetical protein